MRAWVLYLTSEYIESSKQWNKLDLSLDSYLKKFLLHQEPSSGMHK